MTRTIGTLALAAAVLAAAPAAAQTTTFVHAASVYVDANDAALKTPEGVACNEAGAVVVSDTGNRRLLVYALKDGAISGGAEVKPQGVATPSRVRLDSKGDVLVLDRKSRRVARLDPKGAFRAWIQPKGADGVAVGAFAVDAADGVWLLDVVGNAVLAVDSGGAVTRRLPLPKGLFTALAVDAAGTVYAVDAAEAAVWSAGKGANAFERFTPPMKSDMSFPSDLVATKNGLLVVDQNGSGIAVLGPDGKLRGRQLSMGWRDGLVYYPAQLCIGPEGRALVADRENHRVQMFTTSK